MLKLAKWLALLSLGMGGFIYYEVQNVRQAILSLVKLVSAALSPLIALMGLTAAVIGFLKGDRRTTLVGLLGAVLGANYALRVTARHDGFERAFDVGWQANLTPEQTSRMLTHRWVGMMPYYRGVCWQRNVPFYTVPDTGERLICDLWLPPDDVQRSGLAVVYCHGSGWRFSDKDKGTRAFFRHLAAQGHVLMDVAYRLLPHARFSGQLADVKRAIAWMKQHADELGIQPDKVVVAGGSAGAHLALLAAYNPNHPEFDPDDVRDVDTSVCGVISYYAPVDLRALHDDIVPKFAVEHGASVRLFEQGLTINGTLRRGDHLPDPALLLADLLGDTPDNMPERYAMASPLHYVDVDCPPTLIFQGTQDWLVNVNGSRRLYEALNAVNVPVVYVEFPYTEHGFDLALAGISPVAQSALYDVERFLALLL